MKTTTNYNIEFLYESGEAGFDEIVTYVVNGHNIQALFCVQVDIGETRGIDGIAVRKISIPISPDGEELSILPEKLNEVLVTLENEGKVKSSEGGFANIPYNYFLTVDEPQRISSAYYQKGYYDEITEILREFLVEDGTIARIVAMVDSEEEN